MKHITSSETKPEQGSGGPGHTLRHLIAPWTVGSESLWVGETVIQPGVETRPSAIEDTESAHVTIEGEGIEIVEGESTETSAGSFVFIPRGAVHQVINRGERPLKLITISTPPVSRPASAGGATHA